MVFTSLPYVSIISTRIATFEQLSLLFALGTVLSTATPVFVGNFCDLICLNLIALSISWLGFIGDKIGNYKPIIIVTSLLSGFVQIPLLLLDPIQFEERPSSNNSLSTEENSAPSVQSSYAIPLMFVIRLLGFVGIDGTLSLLDASGIAMSKEFEGDFGRQKMWATISITTVPLLTGLIIDAVSNQLGKV